MAFALLPETLEFAIFVSYKRTIFYIMEQINSAQFNSAKSPSKSKTAVNTIEKALDVLFYLHETARPSGVTEIARALHRPKSSVHRLLAALAQRGLVERDTRAQYRPGVALIALGLGALAREPVAAAARPVLEQAAAEVGETFFLVVARAGRLIVLDKAEGSGFLRAAPQVGSAVPVHATAVGKLYRAYAPDLAPLGEWRQYTSKTLTDAQAMQVELEHVRRRGWASNLDEWQMGLSVLAAPILLGTRLMGAVAVATASVRLQELGMDYLTRQIVRAAEDIALRLEGKKQ